MRHPLYLGFFIAFWSAPLMTVGHLLFAIEMSIFMLVAIQFEERDLIDVFGDAYRRYRKSTGMLLPGIGRSRVLRVTWGNRKCLSPGGHPIPPDGRPSACIPLDILGTEDLAGGFFTAGMSGDPVLATPRAPPIPARSAACCRSKAKAAIERDIRHREAVAGDKSTGG